MQITGHSCPPDAPALLAPLLHGHRTLSSTHTAAGTDRAYSVLRLRRESSTRARGLLTRREACICAEGAREAVIAEFAQGRYCLMHLVRREKGGGLL